MEVGNNGSVETERLLPVAALAGRDETRMGDAKAPDGLPEDGL